MSPQPVERQRPRFDVASIAERALLVRMDHQPRPSLRDALAQAILDAKKSAQAETHRWKERCVEAEAQADALRHEVLEALQQPPTACDMDVLDAVVERNGGVGDTTAFWRHVRIVQTVRERAGGAGAEAAGATTAPADVIAFLVDVVASAPAAEPPRHAAAFLDAAFKYLCTVPAPGNGQDSAIQEACSAVAGVIASHAPGAPRDPRPCACSVLRRLAKQQGHTLTAAVLMAVELRLLCSVEACAAAASAGAAAPFDEEPTWDIAAVNQHYENVCVLGCPHCPALHHGVADTTCCLLNRRSSCSLSPRLH
jgi:hypothetical protein